MMLRPQSRLGMGDWFDASCEPGTPGCVPHWYCYIPMMATPDCLQSFAAGTEAIVSGTAQTVGGVVGATAKGVATGALDAATGGTVLSNVGLLLGVGGLVAVLLLTKEGR